MLYVNYIWEKKERKQIFRLTVLVDNVPAKYTEGMKAAVFQNGVPITKNQAL